jgi:chromosome segregation ATPase
MAVLAAVPIDIYEEQLKLLNAELGELRTTVVTTNERATTLSSQIKAIEVKQEDVKRTVAGYDLVAGELIAARNLLHQKLGMVEAVLKDTKEEIDKKISAFDADLAARKKQLDDIAEKAKSAHTAMAEAEQAATVSKAGLANAKGLPKSFRERFTILKAYIAEAAAAESEGDFAVAYFMLSDASTGMTDAIPELADLTKTITDAQAGVESAVAKALVDKNTADEAQAGYESAKKSYDAALQSRRDNLVKLLKRP